MPLDYGGINQVYEKLTEALFDTLSVKQQQLTTCIREPIGIAGTDIFLATTLHDCIAEALWGWGSSKLHAVRKMSGKVYLSPIY